MPKVFEEETESTRERRYTPAQVLQEVEEQLEQNVAALNKLEFSSDELSRIDGILKGV